MKVKLFEANKPKNVKNKNKHMNTALTLSTSREQFLASLKHDYKPKIVSEVEQELDRHKDREVSGQEILTKVLANHQEHRFTLKQPFRGKRLPMNFDPTRLRSRRSR